MNVSMVASYKVLKRGELAGKTVIVVNALRTNATIITALAHGCERVIPVNSVESAMEAKSQFRDFSVLGGEYNALPIQDFELGNSPQDVMQGLEDKVLIHCTSNGTQAINASFDGKNIYIACLINARAVAKRAYEDYDDIQIVCAGTDARLCVSDIFAAGAVVDRLRSIDCSLVLDDCSILALKTYHSFAKDPKRLLSGVRDYENLLNLKQDEAVRYCLSEDILDIVPKYEEGLIHL